MATFVPRIGASRQIITVLVHLGLDVARPRPERITNDIKPVDLQAHRPRPTISRVVEPPIHRIRRIRQRVTYIRRTHPTTHALRSQETQAHVPDPDPPPPEAATNHQTAHQPPTTHHHSHRTPLTHSPAPLPSAWAASAFFLARRSRSRWRRRSRLSASL